MRAVGKGPVDDLVAHVVTREAARQALVTTCTADLLGHLRFLEFGQPMPLCLIDWDRPRDRSVGR